MLPPCLPSLPPGSFLFCLKKLENFSFYFEIKSHSAKLVGRNFPNFESPFNEKVGVGREALTPTRLLPPHPCMRFLTVSSQNSECSRQEKNSWSFSKIWEDLQFVPVSPSLSQLVLAQGHLFLKKILSSDVSYLTLWLHCLETVSNQCPKEPYLTLDIVMNIVDNFSDTLNTVHFTGLHAHLFSRIFQKTSLFIIFFPWVVSCLK